MLLTLLLHGSNWFVSCVYCSANPSLKFKPTVLFTNLVTTRAHVGMINHKFLASHIKAFRLICSQYNIPQVDMTMCIFIGLETVTYYHIIRHNFTIKFSSMLHRGYIEQVQGKGKRFRVTDKGKDVLNQYYSLVSKLSEVKPTKQATKRLIDSI